MYDVYYSDEGYDSATDEASCLFLSKYKLHRATCPFMVTCLVNNIDFVAGDQVEVSKVVGWYERVVLYSVKGKLYPHFFFSYTPPHRIVVTGLR